MWMYFNKYLFHKFCTKMFLAFIWAIFEARLVQFIGRNKQKMLSNG